MSNNQKWRVNKILQRYLYEYYITSYYYYIIISVIIFVAVLILIDAYDKSRDPRPCLVLVSRALISFITLVPKPGTLNHGYRRWTRLTRIFTG